MKFPIEVVHIIVSFLKHGWNYNSKTRCLFLLASKKLRFMKLQLCHMLLYTDAPVAYNSHSIVNRATIEQIMDDLQHYTKGYIVHHKLVPWYLKLSIYYMKRYHDSNSIIDLSIIQKQRKLKQLLICYGYKKRLVDYEI